MLSSHYRGREDTLHTTMNIAKVLTETVILQTISSGKGLFSFFSSRSRHVAISSMNTQTSFCVSASIIMCDSVYMCE